MICYCSESKAFVRRRQLSAVPDIEALTRNLVDNHDMLMAVAENRDLTKEEDAMLENLKRQLETTDKDLIEKVKSSRYLP